MVRWLQHIGTNTMKMPYAKDRQEYNASGHTLSHPACLHLLEWFYIPWSSLKVTCE